MGSDILKLSSQYLQPNLLYHGLMFIKIRMSSQIYENAKIVSNVAYPNQSYAIV